MILEFRAKMENNKWFYQRMKESNTLQHLPSFLRRVLTLHGVAHPTYLKEELEDYLQIKINGEWVQCQVEKPKKDKDKNIK